MYILNTDNQNKKIESSRLVEEDLLNWITKYEDNDGIFWIVYYPHSGYHGGGPRFMRIENIPSDTSSFIDKALSSSNNENIIGCATDLSIGDCQLEEVVKILKLLKNKHQLEAITTFIDNYNSEDKRDNTGKHYTQVEKEYKTRLNLLNELKSLKNC